MVADLDAAADALRRRASLEPPARDDAEPPAPDAEPGIEADARDDAEPPAPDAEPGIEADAPEDAEPRERVEPGSRPWSLGRRPTSPNRSPTRARTTGPSPWRRTPSRRGAPAGGGRSRARGPRRRAASEWRAAPHGDEPPREPVAHAVAPVRARTEEYAARWGWLPPGVDAIAREAGEDDEPPAPDAEPGVEWAMPPTGPVEPAALAPRRDEPAPLASAATTDAPPVEAAPGEVESVDVASVGSASGEAESVDVESVESGSVDSGSVDLESVEPAPAEPAPAPVGPRIVPRRARPPERTRSGARGATTRCCAARS